MAIETPGWVKQAVFYQIFPDRFCKGQKHHAPRGIALKPWGTPAKEQGYQGGDLYGVIEKLDYLRELGITALYLNPIFSSASNHRYHTFDYLQVDPLLGGDAALRALLDAAHERSMKVVLDGVFNHASRGFWAFHHILEEGSNSPYIDWFHIDDFPLNPYPRDGEEVPNYQSWWGLPALPKFNTDNPGVREYLMTVAEHWIDFGIDGWRLDVPQEIDDDSFWQEFRRRVKAKNPDAYICGEIWDKADRWLKGDQFDAVMNYPMGTAALSFFGAKELRTDYEQNHLDLTPCHALGLIDRVETVLSWYEWPINQVQLNLLDSHDMPRVRWLVNDQTAPVKQALAFLLTMPGAPCIYYGTEIGMTGGTDPDCREAFPWQQPETWDMTLHAVIRKHALARQKHSVLALGDLSMTAITDDVILLQRSLKDKRAMIFFNRSDDAVEITVPNLEATLFSVNDDGEKEKTTLQKKIILKGRSVEVFVS